MLRFHADKFVTLSTLLRTITHVFNDPSVTFSDADRKGIFDELHKAIPMLQEMGLPLTQMKAQDIANQTQYRGYDAKHFAVAIDELKERLKDELSLGYFLCLDRNEASLYEPSQSLMSIEFDSKFPSLLYEVSESAKCGALGRDTASAFHAIRCLEGGIRAVSRCLGIPDPTKGTDRNWSNLLRKIDDAIKAKWPLARDRFSGDGQFFEEVYGALSGMQNPYRNATMHLDATYSRDEANVIRVLVRGFLLEISSRMNEDGDPKA